jgi:hypothetical protein
MNTVYKIVGAIALMTVIAGPLAAQEKIKEGAANTKDAVVKGASAAGWDRCLASAGARRRLSAALRTEACGSARAVCGVADEPSGRPAGERVGSGELSL